MLQGPRSRKGFLKGDRAVESGYAKAPAFAPRSRGQMQKLELSLTRGSAAPW